VSKLLTGICVTLLLAFLAEGWYLGHAQGELFDTKRQLVEEAGRNASLKQQLQARDDELLSIKVQLEEAQPRHFSSLEELQSWLASDDTNQMQYSGGEFNCINFALMLQERALADGYILSTEVLPVGAHWVNTAVIGDRIYLIEPQDDGIILEQSINSRS
jgi:hypothetical protein